MKIKKLKDTYNDYQCEISFGQLQAIKNALARDHSDPLADELYSELEWYLQNVPGPGESEDDIKRAEDAMASGLDKAGPQDQAAPGQADELLPPPPGEEELAPEGGAVAPEPEGGELGPEGPEGELEPAGAPAGGPPPEGEDDFDRHLPPPPEE